MRKGEKRRQDILVSAENLFYLQGYDRTTIEDILASLNCSKGSFYHHFESKMQVLEEIASAHIKDSFERFLSEPHQEGLQRLDALLYHASPFHPKEVNMLSVTLSLTLQQEGAVITRRMDDARRRLFFPVLEETLQSLKFQGLAYWRESDLPLLVWETHMAFCHTLVSLACDSLTTGESLPARCLSLLSAARFQWARVLDLPFDALTIAPAQELVDTMQTAYKHLKRFLPEEGLAVQTMMRGM